MKDLLNDVNANSSYNQSKGSKSPSGWSSKSNKNKGSWNMGTGGGRSRANSGATVNPDGVLGHPQALATLAAAAPQM